MIMRGRPSRHMDLEVWMMQQFIDLYNFVSTTGYFSVAKDFLNSQFFTAIVGALLATMMGARAAESVASRKAEQKEMIKELRNINFSVTLAASITNSLIIFKKQIIAPLTSEYFTGKNKFEIEYKEASSKRPSQENAIRVQAHFQTIPKNLLPVVALETMMMEKISINTRAVATFVALQDAISNFEEAKLMRSDVINEFKAAGGYTPFLYYGLPSRTERGIQRDSRYHDSMRGIKQYLDDGIFFGNLLSKDLEKYGEELGAKYKKLYNSAPPKMNKVNFDNAAFQGLLPFSEEYKSWLAGFRNHSEEVGRFSGFFLRAKLYTLFVWPVLDLMIVVDLAFILTSIVLMMQQYIFPMVGVVTS